MSRDDIIRMARAAGAMFDHMAWVERDLAPVFERFAALVADAEAKRIHDEGMVTVGHMREQIAAEREACAALCDARAIECDGFTEEQHASEKLAEDIRARGQA